MDLVWRLDLVGWLDVVWRLDLVGWLDVVWGVDLVGWLDLVRLTPFRNYPDPDRITAMAQAIAVIYYRMVDEL